MAFERIEQTVVSHEGTTTPTVPGTGPRPPRSRWLGPGEKEAEAHKLRAKGHSYRRIAEVLQVQYGLVSRWLSGLGEATSASDSAEPRSYRRGSVFVRATPEPDAPPVEVPADFLTRYQAMEQRVADLLATLSQVARENRERETRLYKALEDERKAATEREAVLKAEIAEVRSLVEDLVAPDAAPSADGTAAPLAPAGLLGRLNLWRRGGVG